jgi:hypothetical protein
MFTNGLLPLVVNVLPPFISILPAPGVLKSPPTFKLVVVEFKPTTSPPTITAALIWVGKTIKADTTKQAVSFRK